MLNLKKNLESDILFLENGKLDLDGNSLRKLNNQILEWKGHLEMLSSLKEVSQPDEATQDDIILERNEFYYISLYTKESDTNGPILINEDWAYPSQIFLDLKALDEIENKEDYQLQWQYYLRDLVGYNRRTNNDSRYLDFVHSEYLKSIKCR